MQDKVTYRFQSGSVEVEIVRQGDYPVEKIKEEIQEIEEVFTKTDSTVLPEEFLEKYEAKWDNTFDKLYTESELIFILKDDYRRISTLNHMDDVLEKCCTAAELYGKEIPIMRSEYIHDFHRKAFNIRTDDYFAVRTTPIRN